MALAALYAPTIVEDSSGSAGLVAVAAVIVFGVPLAVWLRYAKVISSSGGLFAFVEAAAGRRIALLQAGLWIVSYGLYLLYTTASIVYDLLPTVLPGITPYRPLLEIGIPVVLAAVMLAGRTVTVAILGLLAAVQMLLLTALAVVTIGHDAPASSFGAVGPVGEIASATGQTALLFVCGSLPLFLGGEVANPTRTVRRGLVSGYGLVAIGVIAAVFPIAANPAFTRAPIPGMSMARVFSGPVLAVSIGLGVAASVAGVMLVEFLALSRLLHAVTRRPIKSIVRIIAAALVVSGPITLIDPDTVYDDLLKPSLIALWLSQLVVFAVFPRFASRYGTPAGARRMLNVALAAGAALITVYGLYATLQHPSS